MANKKIDRDGQKYREPVFIVKPVARGHGFDYLHLTLIILVAILAVLAFALSFSKPAIVLKCDSITANNTCSNRTQGNSSNGSVHSAADVLGVAERALPYYLGINTSLNLLPYYSLINRTREYYVPGSREWFVDIPYISPYNKSTVYNMTMIVYDSNLSIAGAYLQSIKPTASQSEAVVSAGTIDLLDRTSCSNKGVVPVFLLTDPYAPGSLNSLYSALNASARFGDKVNVSYYFLFSSYSISKYKGFGVANTQAVGSYLFCASKQINFRAFLSNLSTTQFAEGEPQSNYTLQGVAQGSSLNITALDSCLATSSQALNYQAQLAATYNVTSTPQFIVDCKYLSLPQTLGYAVNYSLGNQ